METKELLARFKKFQVGVFIILGVLLITNLVTLGWTLSRLNRLDDRLPISVSCSGSSYYTPPPDGVLASSIGVTWACGSRGRRDCFLPYRQQGSSANGSARISEPR